LVGRVERMGEMKFHKPYLSESLNGGGQLQNLGVDGMIILE